jgi:hypothetical protein
VLALIGDVKRRLSIHVRLIGIDYWIVYTLGVDMSFEDLLAKRALGNVSSNRESANGFSERLKKYEAEFKKEARKLKPSAEFYNKRYDI